ncbi:MAG: molybdopterin-dependent oxidoreductase [Bacillota bacterium]|jgi:hypothetical protein|nr:molybdopterin-dependent oxidoreductase [Bacillota bacterium]NLL60507.1 molybdopterin-dependent oxidoreductase [Tissierellia bacterium]
MKKRVGILIILIVILSITLLVSLKLNKASIEKQEQILSNAQIVLKYNEMEKILAKEEIILYGEVFEAVLDTSTTEPSRHIYKGVQLKDLLKSHNVDFMDKTIVIKAADGYSVAYSSEEVSRDKNVYLAFMEDGKYLGSRDSGGRGPYESIVVSDIFSNRRCKWITEIEVK